MRLLHLTELTILNFTYQGTWVNAHVGHKLMGENRVFDVAHIYLEWNFFSSFEGKCRKAGEGFAASMRHLVEREEGGQKVSHDQNCKLCFLAFVRAQVKIHPPPFKVLYRHGMYWMPCSLLFLPYPVHQFLKQDLCLGRSHHGDMKRPLPYRCHSCK